MECAASMRLPMDRGLIMYDDGHDTKDCASCNCCGSGGRMKQNDDVDTALVVVV